MNALCVSVDVKISYLESPVSTVSVSVKGFFTQSCVVNIHISQNHLFYSWSYCGLCSQTCCKSPTGCVTLGAWLHLSVPGFLTRKTGLMAAANPEALLGA